MTFFQLVVILRARVKIILWTLLVTVTLAVALSLVLPKTYKASATLLLNYKGADPVSGQILPAQLVAGYMATQVDIINSRSVALKAVDNLRLADNPYFKQRFMKATGGNGPIREWLADAVQRMTVVAPSRESSLVDVLVKSSDPVVTADVANGIALAYQQLNLQIKVGPLQQASKYFANQVKALRVELEAAQHKSSQYQQEKGLVSTDNNLDVETTRLNDLSSQLVQVQGQAIEASSRSSQAMGKGGRDSPDVISNVLIQNLKSALAQAEARFAVQSQNLAPNHPQYQAAKAEVDKLRGELNANIGATNNGVANSNRILRQREAEVRAALAEQRTKVLELNRARDELSVLGKEVESAQRAYDAAAQRLTQTELEGQSNQSDVTLLNPAIAPVLPSSPNIPLNVALSILLGGMLGVALAILTELANRRVRSGADLASALPAPMLGAIAWNKPAPGRFAITRLFLPR
jgi:chain length determinant protein EpsF